MSRKGAQSLHLSLCGRPQFGFGGQERHGEGGRCVVGRQEIVQGGLVPPRCVREAPVGAARLENPASPRTSWNKHQGSAGGSRVRRPAIGWARRVPVGITTSTVLPSWGKAVPMPDPLACHLDRGHSRVSAVSVEAP